MTQMCFCLNLSFLVHKMVKWDCLCKVLRKAAGTEQPCTGVVKHRWQGGFLEFQHQLVIWALWLWASYCTGHWGWRGLQWRSRSSQAQLCLMGRAIIKAAVYEAFTPCTVQVLTSELSILSWGMRPHSDNCVSAWVCLVFLFSTNSKPKKTICPGSWGREILGSQRPSNMPHAVLRHRSPFLLSYLPVSFSMPVPLHFVNLCFLQKLQERKIMQKVGSSLLPRLCLSC